MSDTPVRDYVVGRLLRAADQQGIDNRTLAERVGVTVRAIERLWAGTRCGWATVERVSAVLGISWRTA